MEQFYRVAVVATYLGGVSESTVWQWSREGKLKPIKLSTKVTVWAKSDLDAFIQSRVKTA